MAEERRISFSMVIPDGFPAEIAEQIGSYCKRRGELTMKKMVIQAQLRRVERLEEISSSGFKDYFERQLEVNQEELAKNPDLGE